MSVPTLNVSVLENALGLIKMHPELHVQAEWRCYSGMCLAGHMVDQAGVTWVFVLDPIDRHSYNLSSELCSLVVSSEDYGTRLGDMTSFRSMADYPGVLEYVMGQLSPGLDTDTWVEPADSYAIRLAGLTVEEADMLFDGFNGVEELETGIKALANGQRITADTDYTDL